MKTRQHQRRTRRGRTSDLPFGTFQICLPMGGQEPEQGQRPQEPSFTALFDALQEAREAMTLRAAAYTSNHCDALAAILTALQRCIQAMITYLDQPPYDARNQRLLFRLMPFHRNVLETLVVLRGVRAFCSYGNGSYLYEPTGAFWQLRDCVFLLQRECQFVARLEFEMAQQPRQQVMSA